MTDWSFPHFCFFPWVSCLVINTLFSLTSSSHVVGATDVLPVIQRGMPAPHSSSWVLVLHGSHPGLDIPQCLALASHDLPLWGQNPVPNSVFWDGSPRPVPHSQLHVPSARWDPLPLSPSDARRGGQPHLRTSALWSVKAP